MSVCETIKFHCKVIMSNFIQGPQLGLPEEACQSNSNNGVITSGGGISTLTASIPSWQATQVNNYFSTVKTKPASGYSTIGSN